MRASRSRGAWYALRIPMVLATLLGGCASDEGRPVQLFPRGFLFGTAIAGFQAEMGCPTLPAEECEDRGSDWYDWVSTPELVADGTTHLSGQPVTVGPGHWELYEKDYELAAKGLGNNAMRSSLEWSRIFPKSTVGVEGHEALKAIANPKALAHYRRMFDAMRARGLTPLVTLNHYTLPRWIHDAVGCHKDLDTCTARGWLDAPTLLREIAKYSAFVAREFGDRVDLWATLNEPLAVVLAGYLFPTADRTNPPGVMMRPVEAKAVIMAMIEAHARMVDAVRAGDTVDADGDGKPAQVGLVYNLTSVRPANPKRELDMRGAESLYYLYNTAFLNAVIKGELDAGLDRKVVKRPDLAGRMDYLGVNYYTRITVPGTVDPVVPKLSPLTTFNPLTMQVWEDYPRGIYEAAMEGKRFGVPVIVTENGADDPRDNGRAPKFLVEHLTWLQRAVRDGADVRGYFYWTFMDNYEWNHGMEIRMGLYAVDKNDPKKERRPRQAAEIYRRIASEGRIPDDLAARYPAPETPAIPETPAVLP
ncbi:MAG: glycoside hydrolase family 1 protein [Deltaproteobacteria bacterium]|nr:glycoside hydrolase family 1 protein [Deltaproteobacteria bacterium]